MNTFTFSGKLTTNVRVRKNVVSGDDYANFRVYIDDHCEIECKAFATVGLDFAKFAEAGDRIEGVAKLMCTERYTWLQIIQASFLDKDICAISKEKIPETVVRALKERIHFSTIVNRQLTVYNGSIKASEIEELTDTVVRLIVACDNPKARENASDKITFDSVLALMFNLYEGNAKNGYAKRHITSLPKYVEGWMLHVK